MPTSSARCGVGRGSTSPTDAWVVTDADGTIVAYGQAVQEEPGVVGSWGVVLPSYPGARHRHGAVRSDRGARVGSALGGLLAAVPPLHQRDGYRRGRDGDGARPSTDPAPLAYADRPRRADRSGAAPGGIEIGGVDRSRDLPAIHAILVAAFAEDPADHPEPFDEWVQEHEASPSHDPSLWLLARDGGMPVGALIASAGDDGGWVDWLAVLPSHRGRGIAAALLNRSFAAFADARPSARAAQRGCRERDRRDRGLRARRDACRLPMGLVGTLARRFAVMPAVSGSSKHVSVWSKPAG